LYDSTSVEHFFRVKGDIVGTWVYLIVTLIYY